MKELITYSDVYDRPAKLTEDELRWFHKKVKRCKAILGCTVDIIAYDHDLYSRKYRDALGCCLTTTPSAPLDGDPIITIDTFFIHEMYDVEFNDGFNFNIGETLESVIAHEVAHLYVWRHGKKHTALTEKLVQQIREAA